MWIKNTAGKKDAMLTFALISFMVITLNILLSSLGSLQAGDVSLQFEALDSSVMAVYLGATFTAYVSRRWTDTRYVEGAAGFIGGDGEGDGAPLT